MGSRSFFALTRRYVFTLSFLPSPVSYVLHVSRRQCFCVSSQNGRVVQWELGHVCAHFPWTLCCFSRGDVPVLFLLPFCGFSWFSRVSELLVPLFCSLYAWGRLYFGNPLAFVLFLCSGQRYRFCVATMVKWTRRWKPIWIPCGNSFQKAFAEEWEQEVHTSDVPVQECGYRWKDPSTWSWRAHESSDKEHFAHVTYAESGDEKVKACANHIVLRSPWISTASQPWRM